MRLALGLILAFVGAAIALTVAGVSAWASRQYAVGLAPGVLRLVVFAAIGGGLCIIGGVSIVVGALKR
jgi:hypothetical protein